ncbi:MAG: N-6 DNA methylase, partial [Gammaproteobacteria bacterium]
ARSVLACRGENSVLAVIEPGQLRLFPCNRYRRIDDGQIVTPNGQFTISGLLEGRLPKQLNDYLFGTGSPKEISVHQLLFKLLKNVGHRLNDTKFLQRKHETILALVGRALLARFLLDRKILTDQTFPELFRKGDPKTCFSSPHEAALVNHWMDTTFNGDFLPLAPKGSLTSVSDYEKWFKKLAKKAFDDLSLILLHADSGGQLSLPEFIDFAHVPIVLLSEVYERYAQENLDEDIRDRAKGESIHYTPKHIGELMIDQCFSAIPEEHRHSAKVLDPACGAGVFVALAFRRLVKETWIKDGKRPDAGTIRRIMYSQITGLDINTAALNLAALGLYLSALELDPEIIPTEKSRFTERLIASDGVLRCTRPENKPWSKHPIVMGSLEEGATSDLSGEFDLVIGNPPWNSYPASMKVQLTEVVRNVARRKDPKHLSDVVETHDNPHQVPDLPFVWKSMEWAKPDGVIGFALHARFLFKATPSGITSRNHLFKALNVTDILNASSIRQTKVWPSVSAPFCLLFARNSLPGPYDNFKYVCPNYEGALNNKSGRMRIDYVNADPVQAGPLAERPHLLKTLYRGTSLDVEVVDKIDSLRKEEGTLPLGKYWKDNVGSKRSGQGYQEGKNRDTSDLLAMKPRNLTKKDNVGYIIKPSQLEYFTHRHLYGPCSSSIYETPLVLVNKAMTPQKDSISVRLAYKGETIAYNESFFGYSTAPHPQSKSLAEYIFVLLSSDLFLYYLTMMSSEYAVERDAIHKMDIDQFPVYEFESIGDNDRQEIHGIAATFKSLPDFKRLNRFVCKLYGLNKYDIQVVKDSLRTSLPTSESRAEALRKPKRMELNSFLTMLKKVLEPCVFDVQFLQDNTGPWTWLSISKPGSLNTSPPEETEAIYQLAYKQGSTRIKEIKDGTLYVGMLSQFRYWTPTRARLLAIEILFDNPFD